MGTCCCPGCGSLQPAAGLNQVPWPRFPTQEGINGFFFFLGTSFGLVRLRCGGAGVQVYPALSSSRAPGLTSSCPLTQRRVTKTPSEERGPAPARWPQCPAKHPESLGDNCGVGEEGDGLICHRFRMAPRVLLRVPPQWCGQPGSQRSKREIGTFPHFLARDLCRASWLPRAGAAGCAGGGDALGLSVVSPLTPRCQGAERRCPLAEAAASGTLGAVGFNTPLGGLNFEEVKLSEQYFYADSDSILPQISPSRPRAGSARQRAAGPREPADIGWTRAGLVLGF